jgi:hypothetical protein
MTRLNPGIAWILRSPLHPLVSGALVLLTVTGRRSGRRYAIPVGYQRSGDRLTILVSKAARKQWWRNYLEPRPIDVRLWGRERRGEARVLPPDSPEFREAMEASLRKIPFLGRQFGIAYRRGQPLAPEQWQRIAREAAVVAIALVPSASRA